FPVNGLEPCSFPISRHPTRPPLFPARCCASVILSSHNASEKMSVMGEKTITMSRKEVNRLAVIQRLLHQQITTREAAMLLGLSVRQVYRIKARVLQEGEEGIVHKNRGRKPAHALSEDLRHTIVELYQ